MPGTITSDLTAGLINSAEVATDWLSLGTWGAVPVESADIYLELAYAINARATAATGPIEQLAWSLAATSAGLNLTINERHLFFWIKCFSLPALNTRAKGGIGISISEDVTPTKTGTDPWSGPTNSKTWYVTGKDFEPTSGWVCYVIDPTSTPDLLLGTAPMSGVDRAGIRADALLVVGGGSVKPKPTMWDKIAYGTGLIIKDGTTGAPVTMADIYAADSLNANMFGVTTKAAGIYFMAGKLVFGATDQTAVTVFKDVNQVLAYQDFPVAATFYEIKLLGASGFATTVTFGNYASSLISGGCIIRGGGLTTRRAIAPVIVSGGSGYAVGNILTVSGGTYTTQAQVKVITVSGGVITELRMETAGNYSIPPTGTLTLTGGGGTGATCTLTFIGGSIWTLTASAAYQTLNLYGCILSEMKSAALASTTVVRGCTFDNFGNITANGALFDSCTFQNLRTATPISATYAVIVETSVATLTNNKFINCAVQAVNTAAVKWNVDAQTSGKLDGSVFTSGGTGYGVELGANCPAAITLTNVTFSGYSGTPGPNMVENSGSLDAAIHNVSGKTITISVSGGSTPSIRNDGSGSLTDVVSSVTITFTGMKDNTEVRVYNSSTGVQIAGIEDATDGSPGNRSFAWSAAPSLVVDYVIHSVSYETIRVNSYTVPSASGSIPIQQRIDRNYENPP